MIHTFTPSPWIKFGTAIASVVCSAIALTYFHSGGTKLRLLVPLAAIAAFSFMFNWFRKLMKSESRLVMDGAR